MKLERDIREAAYEATGEIEVLYDRAMEEECTCYSDPDGPCRLCNRLRAANRKTAEIILKLCRRVAGETKGKTHAKKTKSRRSS